MALHCYCYNHRGREWLVYHNVPLRAREEAFIRRCTDSLIDETSVCIEPLNQIPATRSVVPQIQRMCCS